MLGLLAATGAVLWAFELRYRKRHPSETIESDNQPASDPACTDSSCSLHDVCPSQKLLDVMKSGEAVYYDDQELDVFKGRDADGYTDDETEMWRDVLYTLQPADLIGWEQSVKRRGLTMPQAVRQEFIMLYGEQLGRHDRSQAQ